MRMWIGIDPGLDGAVAFVYEEGPPVLVDTPTLTVGKPGKRGKKRECHVWGMAHALAEHTRGHHVCGVVLEKVQAMAKDGQRQGASSAFNFGEGFGMWQGILAALCIPFSKVAPQRWQREMLADMGKGKDAARARALQLFPVLENELRLKKHADRAEALLMAVYAQRLQSVSYPAV